MNLNHLGVFHAVAQAGSITRAANRLMISQPAISKQLGELERNLGVRLFDRMPRGVRATDAGVILAEYAGRLFALADDAEHAMGEVRGLKRGRLRVGASTTIGVYLLPELFVRFRQAHPGVQLSLDIAGSDTLAARLVDGTIDVALTEGTIHSEAMESMPFMEDRLVAIAPPGHALTRKRRITCEMLCREPFVVRETGSGTQSLVERTLAQRGLHLKPAMSLGSTEAIKRAVASGVGVAIVSSLSVDLEVQARRLAVLKVADLNIRRPLNRVVDRHACQSQSVRAFIAMLGNAIVNLSRQ